MREEIAAAVLFIGRVVGEADSATSEDKVLEFTSSLSRILEKRFQGHWHTDKPTKGQGYRSIRIHPAEPLDPVLERAASDSGLNHEILCIPVELTVWVDPREVCCRFGDLKATYCTVLTCHGGNLDNKVGSLDIRDLLDNAKAQYSRQQHIRVVRNSPPPGHRPHTPSNGSHYSYGMPTFGSPSNGFHMYGYVEGFVPDSNGYSRNGDDGLHNGYQNGFHMPPPLSSQYQPSFTATAVNTTPRKTGKGGSGGHFRKGNGGGGRGGKSSQQPQGEGASFSHNHNNNLNSNGSTTSSGSNGRSNADRFHWVRNGKGQQQQQQQSSTKDTK